ncbi:hypothetical protein ACFT9I_40270, partial [Streptomyces sp. NPDC057137]|uniref:hypothetical protein n=1 Tax=Streptomyces sp. NPDC057137 TaxID=3346030 RepID=UPI0036252E46
VQDQEPTTAVPVGARLAGRLSGRAFSDLYDRHAAALYSLAWLLFPSIESADEAFVTTMAGAGTQPDDVAPDAERRRLAAALWHRCARDAPRTTTGRSPAPLSQAPAGGSSPEREQALLGLVLFGRHTYAQAADLIGVSAHAAAAHLRSVVHRGANVPGGGRT